MKTTTAFSSPSADPAPEPSETEIPAVASLEELREELTRAIAAAEQPPRL